MGIGLIGFEKDSLYLFYHIRIIGRIKIPAELGTLSPAGKNLNGPSAKVLDEQILAPLGYTRKDAWLCGMACSFLFILNCGINWLGAGGTIFF